MKDLKVLHIEECIAQHRPMKCNFKKSKRHQEKVKKDTWKKIWKLHEDSVKSEFNSYSNNYRNVRHGDASVEGYFNV